MQRLIRILRRSPRARQRAHRASHKQQPSHKPRIQVPMDRVRQTRALWHEEPPGSTHPKPHRLQVSPSSPSPPPQANLSLPVKPFACTICGHRCVTQQQLNNHLTTHTRSKPFTCDHPGCTKSFSVKTALSTHKRTHTNEKPFRCRFCGDSYSDSSNLSKHRKTVHEDANTAIPCPEQGCEYKDSRQQRLERHCRDEGHAGELVRDAQRWAEYTGCWKRKPPRSRTGSVARSSSVSVHS